LDNEFVQFYVSIAAFVFIVHDHITSWPGYNEKSSNTGLYHFLFYILFSGWYWYCKCVNIT